MNSSKDIKNKLLEYGFLQNGDSYILNKPLLQDQFIIKITATLDGKLEHQLIDRNTNEEYILHKIKSSSGSFVGEVKENVNTVLEDIRENCFGLSLNNSQTDQIILFIEENYKEPIEHLWEKFPDTGIFRRKDNQKWYIVLTQVEGNKIGLNTDKKVPIIDLRAESGTVPEIVDNKQIFPGWHMNKKNWYTLVLDGRTENKEIFERIRKSREIVADKKARSKK